MCLEKEVPNVKILTYKRLDWSKRASLLRSLAKESPVEALKERCFHGSNRMKPVPLGNAAVIELFFPSIFRAIVSLHPAGSIDPDAVAFFSPDEYLFQQGGSYMHARGVSVYHIFRHLTEHAEMALQ